MSANYGLNFAVEMQVLESRFLPPNVEYAMEKPPSSKLEFSVNQILCRRYAAVVLNVTAISGAEDTDALTWAIGQHVNDGIEVLGVWRCVPDAVGFASVFRDLRSRGVEFVRFGVGQMIGASDAFLATFQHSELIPSIEQEIEAAVARVPPRHRAEVTTFIRSTVEFADLDAQRSELARFQASRLGERYPDVGLTWQEALARFQPIYSLHPQLQELVRSADQAAADLRKRLTRAIAHHGRFDDSAAALDFVASWLVRAEERLDRERDAAQAATSSSTTARPAAAMSAALAVPTPA